MVTAIGATVGVVVAVYCRRRIRARPLRRAPAVRREALSTGFALHDRFTTSKGRVRRVPIRSKSPWPQAEEKIGICGGDAPEPGGVLPQILPKLSR